ncbi:hypothetical protein ACFH04_00500 [Streptomyces noboritoensis]|uniref:Uncharacterized protein n=1 Tax=Streptomyces noboritoensis TaxID=67337 RepID=A0ABV6TCK0_9ACTN
MTFPHPLVRLRGAWPCCRLPPTAADGSAAAPLPAAAALGREQVEAAAVASGMPLRRGWTKEAQMWPMRQRRKLLALGPPR